ncbi:MAG: hypothetical protein R3C59_29820 [Planctomycetaceae bacterium]
MQQDLVRALEQDIEAAVADLLSRMEHPLPVPPSRQTMHLMAKAAVTVYEAAVENSSPDEKRRPQRR